MAHMSSEYASHDVSMWKSPHARHASLADSCRCLQKLPKVMGCHCVKSVPMTHDSTKQQSEK